MVAHIKDIKADNGTLHTDGIGMIRMSFAQEIYDYHEISDPPSRRYPSRLVMTKA